MRMGPSEVVDVVDSRRGDPCARVIGYRWIYGTLRLGWFALAIAGRSKVNRRSEAGVDCMVTEYAEIHSWKILIRVTVYGL